MPNSPKTTDKVVNLLDRPTYGMGQVDRLLRLHNGTARRWIDGYKRGGRRYPPVIRDESTGEDIVTWGEFVEARLLSEFRDAGVSLSRMRPAVDVLKEELNTPYPLASARTWIDVEGRELVRRVEERVGTDRKLRLVVVRSGQNVLQWSRAANEFRESVKWSEDGSGRVPESISPLLSASEVKIDPLRGFGEPVVRAVRTEVIAELYRAGDPLEEIADLYELSPEQVNDAVRYELSRAA